MPNSAFVMKNRPINNDLFTKWDPLESITASSYATREQQQQQSTQRISRLKTSFTEISEVLCVVPSSRNSVWMNSGGVYWPAFYDCTTIHDNRWVNDQMSDKCRFCYHQHRYDIPVNDYPIMFLVVWYVMLIREDEAEHRMSTNLDKY